MSLSNRKDKFYVEFVFEDYDFAFFYLQNYETSLLQQHLYLKTQPYLLINTTRRHILYQVQIDMVNRNLESLN